MTFAATAEVGLYFKARPVLVDCRRDTFNLDPDQIEQAITAKTELRGHPTFLPIQNG